MENVPYLSCLPDHPLLHVLSYLDYKDLIACSRVCHRFHSMTNSVALWRRQCSIYWGILNIADDTTWKDCFVEWFTEFGRYIDIYPAVKRAWKQIRTFVEKFCPQIHCSLADGLSEVELDELEQRLKVKLPLDYRCSYRLCGGQNLNDQEEIPGLFGSVNVSSMGVELLLSEVLDNPAQHHHVATFSRKGCVNLCSGTLSNQVMAVTADDGFSPGQVYYDSCSPLPGNGQGEFITASCFLEWLTTYAQQLNDGSFPVVDGHIMRYYQEPAAVAATGSITVRVATAFLSPLSSIDPPRFQHSYRITMSMDASSADFESCQLRTRHWTITDEDGKEEKVEGLGVVGEHPVMRPGACFTWTSGTTFATTYGNMRGHFVMTNLRTGADMPVECPLFHMKCLPYQTITERKERVLRTKKNQ